MINKGRSPEGSVYLATDLHFRTSRMRFKPLAISPPAPIAPGIAPRETGAIPVSTRFFLVSGVTRVCLLSAYFATLALSACANTKQRHTGPEVTSFKIEGNDIYSSSEIKEKIVTESTGWWPFAKRKDYDPVTWDKDQERIRRLYGSQGHYRAEVTATKVPLNVARDAHAKVQLKITVKEGLPTKVRNLDVQGDEALTEEQRKKLRTRLLLVPGKNFGELRWDDSKGLIAERLLETGYATAEVSGRATVDLVTHQADATIWIRPGEVYHFGDLQLDQKRTPHINPVWINEQVRLAAPLGQVFSPQAIEEAQKRVYAMGVFSQVELETGKPDPDTRRIPLILHSTTAPFHLLRLGGGAGFDQVRNEVRLIGEWSNNNFAGGLRTLRVRSLVGWAFLPDVLKNVGSEGGTAGVRNAAIGRLRSDFEQPRLFDAPALKLALHGEAERQLQEAFTASSGRMGPEIIWQIRTDLRFSIGYTLDASYLEVVSEIPSLFAATIAGCPAGKDRCWLWLSYLSQRLTFDRRDDPVQPRKGYYFDVEFQEAGGPLAGDFSYVRAVGDVRGYMSWGRLTLAARAQAGSLFSASGTTDDTPILQRLYGGGGMSMRGFGYRRLSQLAAVLDPGDEAKAENLFTIPIGGNGMTVGNVEGRYLVSKSVLLATFYDAGAVTRESWEQGIFGKAFHALGVGVRFLTPVGAIRLDVARRLPNLGSRNVNLVAGVEEGMVTFAENTSCFGFGGNSGPGVLSDGLCQIHLSIGEAF